MDSVIKVPTGVVVGIGKIKVFKTKEFLHSIPTLSFVVAKDDTGLYTATCIQLCLDASAADGAKSALEDLTRDCGDFLVKLFDSTPQKVDAREELIKLFSSSVADEWTHAYRKAQIMLCLKGVDVESSYEGHLTREIQRLKTELDSYRNLTPRIDIGVVDYEEVA